jgi:acetyl/propionyl-CoA carboxylase alpha subunit
MLAKLIVWDENRERALCRMRRALDELHIGGVAHTKTCTRPCWPMPTYAPHAITPAFWNTG